MKLVHPELSQAIYFNEGRAMEVCLESPIFFAQLTGELYSQINGGSGRFILSDGDSVLNIQKNMFILISPFDMDFDSTKFQKPILKELERIAVEDEYTETKELSGRILSYLYRLADSTDYDLELSDEIDIQLLLKAGGIKPARDESELVTAITDYMLLLKRVLKIAVVVTVNLRTFLDYEQLSLLLNTLISRKINILMFENRATDLLPVCVDRLIVDMDLCEI